MRSVGKTRLRKSGPGAAKRANTETEVKLRIPDGLRFLRQLARLKARLIRSRVHEMNTLYDTPEGHLARHAQMLRLRVETPARNAYGGVRVRKKAEEGRERSGWLTFKGPAGARASGGGRYKVRAEHELRVFDDQEMARILEALGLRPWFRYEKFRTTFRLPGMRELKLELDETPIGLFVELEGEPRQINRAAGLLGFGAGDYINKSYGALFMEKCGLSRRASHNEPVPSCGLPDMTFPS